MALTDIRTDPTTGFLDLRGGLNLVEGPDTVAQHIRSQLFVRKGEVPYDPDQGPDWFNLIFVKNPTPGIVQAELTRVITRIGGVEALTNYQQTITAGRALLVTFDVVTTNDILRGELIADPERAAEAERIGGLEAMADELARQGAPALAALYRKKGATAMGPTLAQNPNYSELQNVRDTEEWTPFSLLLYPIKGRW